MRTFNTGRDRFAEPIQIVDGPLIRGNIQRADLKDNPQVEYAFPKIACRVGLESLMRAGQVVALQGGGYYLTADHSATKDYRIFHLFRCDRQVSWTRKTINTDLLTGLEKASYAQPDELGPIWVMWERVRRQFTDTAVHLNAENTLIATGAAVELNDFIEGKAVKRLATALGVRIVELQA